MFRQAMAEIVYEQSSAPNWERYKLRYHYYPGIIAFVFQQRIG